MTTVIEMSAEQLAAVDRAEANFYFVEHPGSFALSLLESMAALKPLGMPVNVYRHSLQTASRCARNGGSDEQIVSCLLHDLGSAFNGENHGAISAEILKPFVSEECYWVVAHHAVFQEHYYAEQLGIDPFRRDIYKSSPHYDAAIRFCEEWDIPSFDPQYPDMPLEAFAPIVSSIFSRRRGRG